MKNVLGSNPSQGKYYITLERIFIVATCFVKLRGHLIIHLIIFQSSPCTL